VLVLIALTFWIYEIYGTGIVWKYKSNQIVYFEIWPCSSHFCFIFFEITQMNFWLNICTYTFSVISADFLAVLRKFGFQFFLICIFFHFRKKTLCVCLLISFNFILWDNALVFCMQFLPATKYSLLHYWSERRALVSKCTVINLSYACAVDALYMS
jgi:hypothetical protein